MFDIGGWGEFLLIVIIAFVVIGPKDMPKVLYQAGRGVRAIQKFMKDAGLQFDQMMQEVDHQKMNEQILEMEKKRTLKKIAPKKTTPMKTTKPKRK